MGFNFRGVLCTSNSILSGIIVTHNWSRASRNWATLMGGLSVSLMNDPIWSQICSYEMRSGPRRNIETVFRRQKNSHVKDKTTVRPSYLQHSDLYAGKTTYLYWGGPQGSHQTNPQPRPPPRYQCLGVIQYGACSFLTQTPIFFERIPKPREDGLVQDLNTTLLVDRIIRHL